MKLLFDADLSMRLKDSLSSLYPASEHVHNVHLGGSDVPSATILVSGEFTLTIKIPCYALFDFADLAQAKQSGGSKDGSSSKV